MTGENNIFSLVEGASPLERAKLALCAARQYQEDWLEHGVDRVHLYFDDVEGDWLESIEEITVDSSSEIPLGVTLSEVIAQLKSLGLSKSFIEKIAFPSWYNHEYQDNEVIISKILKSICKRLFLKINYQDSSSFSLSFLPIPAIKSKLQITQTNSTLFSYLVRSVAYTVIEVGKLNYSSVPSDALVLRNSILKINSCVNLNSLIKYCWNAGIPVVHLDFNLYFNKKFGHTKFDGFVVIPGNKTPVIVIGSSRKYSAWLLFILAHELGHIALGHLQQGILSDESFQDGQTDEEENDANQFAQRLLFGDINLVWSENLNSQRLLRKVIYLSEEHKIDPGVLILNYAWQTGNWGCAMKTMKNLEPRANAPADINAYCQRRLEEIGYIDQESKDYLEKINILVSEHPEVYN